ncbi:MAG: 16S rRNA (cytosine(1402)-N(4))-methyltransferase RsmH [Actinobacteria bacterium]|nr:16S rRNA (cytosine(1402)-N(4))-methyltransferase RsmH [Actinomycetota bacterium]
MEEQRHRPVMVEEVIRYLAPAKGEVIVDGTLGTGGHAEAILERIAPTGRLIGIDRDPEAIAEARVRLGSFDAAVGYHRENYRDIQSVLDGEGIEAVDGVLLDLGVSSLQFDDPSRGFSFRGEGPLDMRMGPDAERTAADIVNEDSEDELTSILYRYGEERWARRIAHFIYEARGRRPIRTTTELEHIVEDAVPAGARRGRKHPARKTFQALRIAVNHELDDLKEGITAAIGCLAPSGRIVVLSYHSLEDRVVKHTFGSLAKGSDYPPGHPLETGPVLFLLTRKPVTPGEEEIESNPRARSAKLRAARRVA